jgi:hypothetical protein
MLLEMQYSIPLARIENNYAELEKHYELPMSLKRYKTIQRCLIPSKEDFHRFNEIVCNAAKSLIIPSSITAIDEAVLEYHPLGSTVEAHEQIRDGIPLRLYPDKPHDFGFVIYGLTAKFPKWETENGCLPYVFDMQPYIDRLPKSHEVVLDFTLTWKWTQKCHFVCDSAFGNERILQEIIKWGGGATFAMPKPTYLASHALLFKNLEEQQWRGVYQASTGVVAVVSSIPTDSNTEKCLKKLIISSHFVPKQKQIVQLAPEPAKMSESEARKLLQFDVRTLQLLASGLGLPTTGSAVKIAERISNRKLTPSSPEEVRNISSDLQVTRKSLNDLKVEEIELICDRLYIKTGNLRRFL